MENDLINYRRELKPLEAELYLLHTRLTEVLKQKHLASADAIRTGWQDLFALCREMQEGLALISETIAIPKEQLILQTEPKSKKSKSDLLNELCEKYK